MDNHIAPGQKWSYKARLKDKGTFLIILQVDKIKDDTIVHVALYNLDFGKEVIDIEHVPISFKALQMSLDKLINSDVVLPEFEESLNEWRKANGGAWNVALLEVVKLTEETFNQ